MSGIRIFDFRGETPRQSIDLMGDNYATLSVNCKLTNGELRSFRGLRRVHTPSKPGTKETIYRYLATPGGFSRGRVTNISQRDIAQVTSENHRLETNDRIYIAGVNRGNHPINNETYTVTRVNDNAFNLKGVNSLTWPTVKVPGYWTEENGYWAHWTSIVHASYGPVNSDEERLYYTGDGQPKMTYASIAVDGVGTNYPVRSRDLGIPRPLARPTVVDIINSGRIVYAGRADPVTIQSDEHGLRVGTYIRITGVVGMTQLNDRVFRVKRVQQNLFWLGSADNNADIDGTNYGTYISGGTWVLVPSRTELSARETREYCYTYVSALGEEGPPSAISLPITVSIGQQVNVGGMSGDLIGNNELVEKRIYRTATGAGEGAFQLAGRATINQATFSDTRSSTTLGEVLQSLEYYAPPANLRHLIALPNGVMAGASKEKLCLSEPGLPYAWPPLYRKSANQSIVGLGSFGNSIVVVTEGQTYVADGTDPSSIELSTISLTQGCVSRRSIVSVGLFGVMFASHDGLILVSDSGPPQIISEGILHRDEWAAFNPRSIHAYVHDNKYIAFYATPTEQGGFIFDPQPNSTGFVRLPFYADAGYSDPLTDKLYLQIGKYIEEWDSVGQPFSGYEWISKRFDAGSMTNYGAAEVIAGTYRNLQFKFYADNKLIHSQDVKSSEPFRLPGNYRTRFSRVELRGTDSVKKVTVAENMEELG